MHKHLLWLSLILIPAIIAAPMSRIYKNNHYISEEAGLNKQLVIQGLNQVNAFNPTNAGPYQVQEFSPQYCDGSILLLPVYRNAEGTHILKHFVDNNASSLEALKLKQGIIFQQEIFTQLPQWRFTLFQAKRKLQQVLQLPQNDLPALVYAEKGECDISHYLANNSVITFSK